MRRMLTLATIHFQARAPEEIQARLVVSTLAKGIPYHVAVEALKRLAHERSRAACAQLYAEAAGWTAEQWAEVREVREAAEVRPLTPA